MRCRSGAAPSPAEACGGVGLAPPSTPRLEVGAVGAGLKHCQGDPGQAGPQQPPCQRRRVPCYPQQPAVHRDVGQQTVGWVGPRWAPEGCRGHSPMSAHTAALHLQCMLKCRAERLCKTSKQSAAKGEQKRQAKRQAGAMGAQPPLAPSAREGG